MLLLILRFVGPVAPAVESGSRDAIMDIDGPMNRGCSNGFVIFGVPASSPSWYLSRVSCVKFFICDLFSGTLDDAVKLTFKKVIT